MERPYYSLIECRGVIFPHSPNSEGKRGQAIFNLLNAV